MRAESVPFPPPWAVPSAGFGLLLTTTALAQHVGLRGHGGALWIVVLAGVCAIRSGPGGAMVLGLLAWGLTTGFLVNTYGELTFRGVDPAFLVLAVVIALASCLLARLAEMSRTGGEN